MLPSESYAAFFSLFGLNKKLNRHLFSYFNGNLNLFEYLQSSFLLALGG